MTQPEKLRVARALAELGVDVIEAGFPAASRGDWESVKRWRARCRAGDLRARTLHRRGYRAGRRRRCRRRAAAPAACVPGHQPELPRYKTAHDAGADRHRRGERRRDARELCGDVEFSPEDASRTELEFLAEVIERVIEAGATTINIPDTMGYTVPDEFSELFRYLRSQCARHRPGHPVGALP